MAVSTPGPRSAAPGGRPPPGPSSPNSAPEPRLVAGRVVQHVDVLTTDRGEGVLAPTGVAGNRPRKRVFGEPAHVGALEWVAFERPADGAAVEHQQVHRHPGES